MLHIFDFKYTVVAHYNKTSLELLFFEYIEGGKNGTKVTGALFAKESLNFAYKITTSGVIRLLLNFFSLPSVDNPIYFSYDNSG